MKECWINVYQCEGPYSTVIQWTGLQRNSREIADNLTYRKFLKYRLHVKLKDKLKSEPKRKLTYFVSDNALGGRWLD